HTGILFQLRSGHIALWYRLHRIGKAASPTYPAYRQATEIVFHYLMSCTTFDQQRRILQ
ncbi:hypothetical protein C8Q75DRAFT_728400, partial [Abortiporus biennis]